MTEHSLAYSYRILQDSHPKLFHTSICDVFRVLPFLCLNDPDAGFYPITHKRNPYTTLAATPKTITGPAIVNIFAAVPRI